MKLYPQAEIQSLEQQLIAEKENTLLSTKKAFVEVEKDRHFSQISAELEKSKVRFTMKLKRFGLVSLFNGISTFVGYLMPKSFF